MPGAVACQRLGQPTQHQIAVGLKHHIDEVDDDDATDIAQPQLANDLLGCLQIVLGDGLLKVSARPGELSGVDVDDCHRLGAVDHQRATGWQPHLAVHRFGQLLADPVHGEDIRPVRAAGRVVFGQLRNQLGGNGIDIFGDGLPGAVTRDDQPGEVLVEQIADHLDQHIGLFVQSHRHAGGLGLDLLGPLRDADPSLLQAGDVTANVVFLDALGRGTDDHTRLRRHHFAQDLLESLTLGVGQFAADTGGRCTGHVDEIPAGQRQLGGQPRAFVSDRILADLNDDVIAGLEGLLDLAVGTPEAGCFPVHLAGVEDTVATAADIDERSLHGRQHVLHDAEVDIAHEGCRRRRGHEVFDDNAVLENRDLGVARTFVRRLSADLVAHHHDAVNRLPAGEELGLGQDRWAAAAGIPAIAATLSLRLQAGGSADALDLTRIPLGLRPWRALVDHGVGRVVGRARFAVVAASRLAASAASATTGRALSGCGLLITGVVIGVRIIAVTAGLLIGDGGALRILVLAVPGSLAPATSAATAPATPTTVRRPLSGLAIGEILVLIVVDIVIGVGIDRRGHDGLRGDEKRHVRRRLHRSRCLGDRRRFRVLSLGFLRACERLGGVRLGGVRLGSEKFANPRRLGLVDTGLSAA